MYSLELFSSPFSSHFNVLLEIFSRDKATLYEGVSVRPSVGWSDGRSVTSYFFGLLGETNAVYTALFSHLLSFSLADRKITTE